MKERLSEYDLLIVGGGINGAGIARDASGRGLKVCLVEQGDLASATSSASSKLVHGGLRYLEYYEFRLVRDALREREKLLKIAPHIIWPLEFVLPHVADMRPAWLMQAGLLLYDNLAPRQTLAKSRRIHLPDKPSLSAPLKENFTTAFTYADCWVDDARLVVLNAMDAAAHGAAIKTRMRCVGLERVGLWWHVHLQRMDESRPHTVKARVVVNASGPWVNDVAELSGVRHAGRIMQVKGSHIVVPRIHTGKQAYILQMPDKRIIFLLPFEDDFTLIGTTDINYENRDPTKAAITKAEITYLLNGANRYLATPLKPDDVVWSYAGVRSLYDDASESLSAMTRDYVLELDGDASIPPLLSVFGGKITTYRVLAEKVMDKLMPFFPHAPTASWTDQSTLPGGSKRVQLKKVMQCYPWLPKALAKRWCRQYGNRLHRLMGDSPSREAMGAEIAPNIYECELIYARTHEFARTGEDFLWRRTKLGLRLNLAEKKSVTDWFSKQ